MNPKHHNPTQPRRNKSRHEFWARAPYNFVPLPEKVVVAETVPPQDRYYAEPSRYTGCIECALTTESPLYTRTALNPVFFQQWAENSREMMKKGSDREKYAQFFHLDDAQRPVIPGSSLRGMVRSLVEIVGYGKMQWVTNEPLVFRAVGDTTGIGESYRERFLQDDGKKRYTPLMRAGYLERQGERWVIRSAQVIKGTTFARIHRDKIPQRLTQWHGCKNSYRIWVKLGLYDYQKVRGGFIQLRYTPILDATSSASDGLQEAVLVYSGGIPNKKREAVFFPPDPDAPLIEVGDDLIRSYREQLSQEQKDLLGKEGALNPHQPVFYLVKNSALVFFGHAMMFRLPYPRTPFSLVAFHLCSESDIDLAEAIFGYTSERSRKEGKAGRVFFTDAHVEPTPNGVWLSNQPITPAILGSPKPTTFQHYLTQQEPDNKQRLDHYASPPPHEAVIRGHKLYWHRGTAGLGDLAEKDSVDWSTDTQHTQIKPVKAGVSFRCQIYFENLSRAELGALLWVLTLPGETGKQYRHKLGMGKPLGMGSVKITPTLYLSNRQDRYSRLFEGDTWRQAEKSEPDLQPFIDAFEKYVLAGMEEKESRGVESLKQVERIEMFLKMLEWPGPDRQLTTYMQIEDPVNEYKERPVLPDPLNIEQTSFTSTRPSPTLGKRRGNNLKRRKKR